MDETPLLQLPLLRAGQAQKEVTHNEALFRLDALAAGAVAGIATAPPSAAGGDVVWIVGQDATGDWAGLDGQLAIDSPGGWRYCAVSQGQAVWDRSQNRIQRFLSGNWVLGASGGSSETAVVLPAGGPTQDAEARACLGAIVSVLRELDLLA